MDANYQPDALERRSIFGLTLEQTRNDALIDRSLFVNAVTNAQQVNTIIVHIFITIKSMKTTVFITIYHLTSNNMNLT